MSELVTLMSFRYTDPRSVEQWAINHAAHHKEKRDALQADGGPNLIEWQLYPINFRDWAAYAIRHQSAHNELNSQLGVAGTDLTQIDFDDPQAAADWHQEHFREHQAWESLL